MGKTYNHKDFLKLAKKKFDKKKIITRRLKVSIEDAKKIGLTKTAIERYQAQAWIPLTIDKGYLCPNCDAVLGGIFGSFQWGICHGIGFCNNCKKIEFRYYHYVKKGKPPALQLFALSGF